MTAVRCREPGCNWTGSRKTDAAIDTPLVKPCPNGHTVVVGGPPPTKVETTPSGFRIEFWDSHNIESGAEQRRRYTVNGDRLQSVTTILGVLAKDALLGWVERLTLEGLNWRDVRDEAGERGHESHDLLLRALLSERTSLSDLPDEYRAWGQAAFRWLRARAPKVIQAECMVASVEHGYAGRFDLLAQLGRDRPRIDFKTSTNWAHKRDKNGEPTDEVLPPYPETALQLDLYEGAAVESGYPPADYGLVVRLGPDGRYDETPFELDPERGLRILNAYRARAEANKALVVGLPEPELAAAA